MSSHPTETEWRDHLSTREAMKQTLDTLVVASEQQSRDIRDLREIINDRVPTKEELTFLREQWSDDKWRAETWKRVQKLGVIMGIVVGLVVAYETLIEKVQDFLGIKRP